MLATVTVFSLVISISVGIIQNVIQNAKDNSYRVTISNIEKSAGNFISEYGYNMFWKDVPGDSDAEERQYQCIRVQDLIDTGYFKGDVLDSYLDSNTQVNGEYNVLVEIDKNTRNIKTNKLLFGEGISSYGNLCNASDFGGSINFSVTPSGWAREKEVLITYRINSLEGENKYYYETPDNNEDGDVFDNLTEEVKFNVYSVGQVSSAIYYANGTSLNNLVTISGIDKEGPIIKSNYNGSLTVLGEIVIPINIVDKDGFGNSGSGLLKESLDINDFNISVGGNPISGYSLELVNCSDDTNCNYKLTIKNIEYEGELNVSIDENKVFDKVGNGNKATNLIDGVSFKNIFTVSYDPNGGSGEMEDTMCVYGNDCTLRKNTFTKTNYEFKGWNTVANVNSVSYNDEHVFNPFDKTNNITLYAIWKEKEDDGSKEFENGTYFCTQKTISMAMFSSKGGDMGTFVSNSMGLLSSGTEFCYLKDEFFDLIDRDGGCVGFLGNWPFVSAYVLKSDFSSSKIPAENIEIVDGVEYVYGFIPLQNGGMCLTDLPCPGMDQFKKICE